eukprot:TRINITY_DN5511_c0_g1_i1.p1 TRINITY_DN5511_c0_g1~~TRINITY_DN5511_c0_g1_i1.p1  ORF type:complete len:695 (+),score=217.04 TRINITY_DN5511_c0_g1_i1:138-2222(+)
MRLVAVVTAAAWSAGAAVVEVCPAGAPPGSAQYARKGEACYEGSRQCLNADVRLDDNQPAWKSYSGGRYGADLGLFCDTLAGSGKCEAKRGAGERCLSHGDCQSRVCRRVDNAAAASSQKVCVGLGDMVAGMKCHTPDEPCEGGLCWEDRAAPFGAPTYTCRAYSQKDAPCEMLWQGTGADASVVKHTCHPSGGDAVRYTSANLYCAPHDAAWRPPANASLGTHHQLVSVGTCREAEVVDDGASCANYSAPLAARPSCGFAQYCRAEPGKATCRDAIDEGDGCDAYDYEIVNGQRVDGCEKGAACNLVDAGGTKGTCEEWFSRKPGETAGHPELCELDSDAVEAGVVYQDVAAAPPKCATAPYATCDTDADCHPAGGVPLLPLYCRRGASETGAGQCRPFIPPQCVDEWKSWREWTNGERYKMGYSLRIRDKTDKGLIRALTCCYHKHTEAGCLRDGAFVRGAEGAMMQAFGNLSSPIRVPAVLARGQWLGLDEGEEAEVCASEGVALAVIIVLALLGACLLGMCVFILVKEFQGGATKEPRREREEVREPQRPPVTQNPLPPQEGGGAAAAAGGFDGIPPPASPASPADPGPAAPLVARHDAAARSAPDAYTTPPPRGAAAAALPAAVHAPGADVLVWYQGDQDGFHGWFDATVLAYNPQAHTYDVRYPTNELSHGVSAASIAPKTQHPPTSF